MNLHQIYSPERDIYLRELKERVICGQPVADSEGYSDFVSEWQRSVEHNVDCRLPALGDEHRDFRVFENVSAFTKFKLALLDDFVIKKEDALAELDCAIFYLDNNLSTFRTAGSPQLLEELKRKGLRHGTQFTVENVGCFVANLCWNKPGESLCRVGEENYLEIFADYACFARYEEEDIRNFRGSNLIFAPKSKYTVFLKKQLIFFLDSNDMTMRVSYPFMETRHKLLWSMMYTAGDIVIVMDKDGDVVFTNRNFETEFNKRANRGLFENIRTFMPELTFALKYSEGREVLGREILLANANGMSYFYSIHFELVNIDNRASGIKCTLVRAGKKKAPAGKAAGQTLRYSFDSIIGDSDCMKKLKELGRDVAQAGSNVLITGESGTGKELFAQSIHAASKKSDGPFVPVNCAAIPSELMNSELFGYENGAFTGAQKGGYAGKFEQANNGTIFLDEIAELPLSMQGALLRILEDGVVSRLGGSRYIPLDVRIVAATNKDLWQCVQNGNFRADLYFRLNIAKIVIPPLRDRTDDIPALVEHMVSRLAAKGVCRPVSFTDETTALLCGYDWPGNVRELRNIVERCAVYAKQPLISPASIPTDVYDLLTGAGQRSEEPQPAAANGLLAGSYRDLEGQKLRELMMKYNGNKTKVANELSISRGTLYKRLEEYGLI